MEKLVWAVIAKNLLIFSYSLSNIMQAGWTKIINVFVNCNLRQTQLWVSSNDYMGHSFGLFAGHMSPCNALPQWKACLLTGIDARSFEMFLLYIIVLFTRRSWSRPNNILVKRTLKVTEQCKDTQDSSSISDSQAFQTLTNMEMSLNISVVFLIVWAVLNSVRTKRF